MKFVSLQDTGWQAVDAAETAPAAAPQRLLTLAQWQAVRASWPAELPVAVTLPNTFDVEELAADLPRIALLALQFPKWTDGRAYSQARTLRVRLGYQGEVRATGEVLVDMLPLLQRTGVDAVQLRADQREESARRALTLVTENYQGDVSQTRPLFARLAA